MPTRFLRGYRKGELAWKLLTHSWSLRMLHNPIYAGIYCYGRKQIKNTVEGKKQINMPVEEWHANMADAHPGYITGDQFDENLSFKG
jgi:hypothetical protein